MRVVSVVLSGVAALIAAREAGAKVNVVATIPDFAQIAREVGGDRVSTTSLVRPTQDPHFVDARPSFVVDLSRADLLVFAGAELEGGWLPPLVRSAGNPRILPGRPGHLDVSAVVPLKEVPGAAVDRSAGDVHPAGNPHTWIDPRNGLRTAIALAERLKAIDPDGADIYDANLRDFARRLGDAMRRWRERLAPHAGTRVVVYHRSWVYFLEWAGLVEVAAIEAIPGIPPADGDLVALVETHRGAGVRLAIGETFYPSDRLEFVARGLGAVPLILPIMTGGCRCATYIELIEHLVGRIVEGLGGGSGR